MSGRNDAMENPPQYVIPEGLTDKERKLFEEERRINAKLDAELLSNPEKVPKAVWYIIPNEFCERFAYYGVKPLLMLYFRNVVKMPGTEAEVQVHNFGFYTYFFPLLGAFLSDSYLGKYWTIVPLSVVYFIGLALLTLFSVDGVIGSYAAGIPSWAVIFPLVLIGLGTGGIKPCVSAHGGDQYLPHQQRGLDWFFSLFYLSINSGALLSGYIMPLIKDNVKCFGQQCYPLSFGIPALLFLVALVIFILGHKTYRIVPPRGEFLPWKAIRLTFTSISRYFSATSEQRKETGHVLNFGKDYAGQEFVDEVRMFYNVLYMIWPVIFFWMLYDQKDTSWQSQYLNMNHSVFGWFSIPTEAFGNVNAVFVVICVPILAKWVYPFIENRGVKFGLLRRMATGMFLTIISFCIYAAVQAMVDANPGITNEEGDVIDCSNCISGLWQVPQYFILSLGESMTSPMGLNFTYAEVGRQFKSISSSFWLLMIAIGNFLVVAIKKGFEGTTMEHGTKPIWFYVGLGTAAALIFCLQAYYYDGNDHIKNRGLAEAENITNSISEKNEK